MIVKTIDVDVSNLLKELIGLTVKYIAVIDNEVLLKTDGCTYKLRFKDTDSVAVKVRTDVVATVIIGIGDVWINMVIKDIKYEDYVLKIDGEVVGDIRDVFR